MLNYIALLAVQTRTATPQNEAAILSRNIIECIRKQGLRAKWSLLDWLCILQQ